MRHLNTIVILALLLLCHCSDTGSSGPAVVGTPAAPKTTASPAATGNAPPAGQTKPETLQVALVAQEHFALGAAVNLTLHIHNNARTPKRIGSFQTPLEEMSAPYLKVTGPDGGIPYTGKTVKRDPPGPEDFFQLPPNTKMTADVPLSDGYTLGKPGTYTVQFIGNNALNHLPDSNVVQLVIK